MDLANVTAAIRVDTATNKGSVIDVIKIVQSCNASDASTYCKRLLDDVGTHIGTRCTQLRINGKGKLTFCADAKTLVEIVWSLPGKAAREFRRTSAKTVCRVLGGDLSIVREVEARHHALQSTGGGRAAQDFLLGDESSGSEAPAEERTLARTIGEVMRRNNKQAELDLSRMRDNASIATKKACAEFAVDSYEMLRSMGAADDRDRITFSDAVRRIVAEGGGAAGAIVEAGAVPADDPTVPTSDCDAYYRGEEISMHSVSSKYSLRIGNGREGAVGRAVKALYLKRYGEAAAAKMVKRNVPFHGQIYGENTYWARDEDLMKQAIVAVNG
ncbi:hypothetical protein JKP88DRAFT_165055 [Tribonema minus]|uniref:Uncharacterized protein n=1 Tax=Tribonema minus TaxID=303371 RepID=A0A835YWG0_9STRA|nr:hypothetical protein JKP88DRAFT_165055 [Tribonema minus]